MHAFSTVMQAKPLMEASACVCREAVGSLPALAGWPVKRVVLSCLGRINQSHRGDFPQHAFRTDGVDGVSNVMLGYSWECGWQRHNGLATDVEVGWEAAVAAASVDVECRQCVVAPGPGQL